MIDDIFVPMLSQNLDALRSGQLNKGKFIARYIEALNKVDKENAFRFKRPQVIGNGKEPENNWLDYVINMPEVEYNYFKESLT